MVKEVLIQVVSTQSYEQGSEERIEFSTVGNLHKRQGSYYIIYRDSETTGGAGVTTSLKVEPAKVTLNRMGAIDQKQVFERGILHGSAYSTPQGSLFLQVFTEDMKIDLTEQGGNITLKYNLFIDDQWVSHNSLWINIKEDAPR
ncbi:MAG TPA: DUF1934 domain-containing protein [Desulfitobacterium dehalogenans]|uniref:DUF1934 domain-containing protein n=1 Tax=Desulfitobacterium dehalogenans TaxID=36854 RepID=A0A7C6Z2S9_9FIRM|nr:DUF1934 domain-containing protein [Desulfitobacterium dehalogenans]